MDPELLDLFDRPTPVSAARRLAAELGVPQDAVVVKREDLIGVAGGGNKVRKLSISADTALRAGARVLVTSGAAQSNHARATAAVGAMLGLGVVLVLAGRPSATSGGNLLLDRMFGARIIWAGDRDAEELAGEEMQRLHRSGVNAVRIPFGGSSPESAEAYRQAGREILMQVPKLTQVVVAVGSGATMAGLVAELGPDRVLGVSTGAVADARDVVADIVNSMPGAAVRPSELRIDDSQIGDGYAHVSKSVENALLVAARTEGLILDPIYTGRAMAGLISCLDRAERPGPIVFVHTGGAPGLFAHPGLFPDDGVELRDTVIRDRLISEESGER